MERAGAAQKEWQRLIGNQTRRKPKTTAAKPRCPHRSAPPRLFEIVVFFISKLDRRFEDPVQFGDEGFGVFNADLDGIGKAGRSFGGLYFGQVEKASPRY